MGTSRTESKWLGSNVVSCQHRVVSEWNYCGGGGSREASQLLSPESVRQVSDQLPGRDGAEVGESGT